MKILDVYLKNGPDDKALVGKLAQDRQQVYFQYASTFLSKDIWLSPYRLPLQPDAFEHNDLDFAPVFGLFNDSLPDGWGMLLMDRYLRTQGIDTDTFSELDMLSFFGDATMGALVYEPAVDHENYDRVVDLQSLAAQSRKILEGKDVVVLPELARIGGSPQGARPKVLVGLKGNHLISGALDLPEGYEHWLVKFPSQSDNSDSGKVEFAYSVMAEDAGLEMPETRLFETDAGHSYFGVKRFDRDSNNRRHVHSLAGLTHSNFRIPQMDYLTFIRVVSDLTKNQFEVERGFRQMVFNILANNRDDHGKNFAFVMGGYGNWALSPSYDVTYSPGPSGEHFMTVAGEGRSPGVNHVRKIGSDAGLSPVRINDVIDRTITSVEKWEVYASRFNISEATKNLIQGKINRNMESFGHTL